MYQEIILECERSLAESLSDALVALGALAASIEDAQAGTELEEPMYGEPGLETDATAWRHSRVVVLFAENVDFETLITHAERAVGVDIPLPRQYRAVADEDWVRLTQSQFEPIEISERIFIVPSWHTAPTRAAKDAILIALDPGLAFGTGSHATTRLCLEWLDQSKLHGCMVIDYGCGSGILAIAAKRLGAARVLATDIDPQALTASHDNAIKNSVELEIFSATGLPTVSADVVVANILSNPLKVLAPLLASLVKPGGSLVVSGVLERQVDEVCSVYRDVLPLSLWRTHDGWACLSGQRNT